METAQHTAQRPTAGASPSPREDTRRTFSPDEQRLIIAAMQKPYTEWTDEEADLMMRHESESLRRRAEAEASARRVEEEAAKASREYAERLRRLEEEEDGKSVGWFMSQLAGGGMPQPVRVGVPQDRCREYLEAAYRRRVQMVGMLYLPDVYTEQALSDVSRWLVSHTKSGLMLRGYIGTGKTTMLMAMADVLRIALKQTLRVVDAREVANEGRKGGETLLKELAKTPLLGIDDLGTEPQTVKNYGNDLSPVAELLTERYNRRAFTVITTNLTVRRGDDGQPADELQEVYGDRLFDRFREQYNTISYNSEQKSYRG